jgi:sugar phosphate permease
MSDVDARPAGQRRPQTAAAEFADNWPVLVGAIIGIGVGIIALPTPAVGVFMRDLQAEFGWTRTEISLGPTILIALLALVSPLLGWIADRIAAVWITSFSLASLALTLYLFSHLGPELWLFYVGFAVMAVTGCGAATLVYARVVSASFDRGRGLALGIAMIGNGITGIVLPIMLVPYAATAGWRQGFVALATIVAVAIPLVAYLLSRGRSRAPVAGTSASDADVPGTSLDAALRDPVFWTMAACFALIPFAASGLNLHFLAFLADSGVNAAAAGIIASLGGVALIVGRLATGWLIDRAFAPRVAAAMMTISALCIAAMGIFGAPVAALGAIAVGLSIGAELDLIGYMTARYFGFRAFGRIYGLLYAAVLAGSAGSPIAYGLVSDITHSYAAGLYAAAALLLLSAAMFLTMRRFSPMPAES